MRATAQSDARQLRAAACPTGLTCGFVCNAGTELRVVLPEVYASTAAEGDTETATVVPVPFKPVDAAEERTGMKGGQKMAEAESGSRETLIK